MTSLVASLASFWLAVATHLWQTSLILVPLVILAFGMRRAPAGWLHGMWSLTLCKVLVPLAWCSAVGGWLAKALGAGWFDGGNGAHPALGTAIAVLNPTWARLGPGAALGQTWTVVLPLVTLLWVGWVAVLLVRLAREVAASGCDAGTRLEDLAADDRGRLDAARHGTAIPPARLRVTQDRGLPRVAGLLHPSILVPRFLLISLGSDELRAVLLHEEAHRRRRDPLRSVLLRLCGAFLCFYPPFAALVRRLQQTSELVCDEFVLRSGVDGERYARALARTLRLGFAPARGALAAGIGNTSLLHSRFERLSNPRRFSGMTSHRFILTAAVTLVAAASFLPVSLANSGAKPAESTQPESKLVDDLVLPKLLSGKHAAPVYPEVERKAGVEGVVHLEVVVKADGSVGDVRSQQTVVGHPAFTESATAAVRQWRFEPGTRAGNPVDCTVVVPVAFKLSKK